MSYLNNDEIEVTSIVQFDVEKKPKNLNIFFVYGTTGTVNLWPLIFN